MYQVTSHYLHAYELHVGLLRASTECKTASSSSRSRNHVGWVYGNLQEFTGRNCRLFIYCRRRRRRHRAM